MTSFTEIIARIKSIEKLRFDAQVSELLGCNTVLFATWKKRNSIPYSELLTYCNNNSVSMNWLLTGDGPIHIDKEGASELERLREENQQLKKDLKKIDEFIELVEERRSRNRRDPLPGIEGAS